MTPQPCLAFHREDRELQLLIPWEFWLDDIIWFDASRLDGPARRRVIARGGEAESAIRTERNHRLYRPLTERAGTDQLGSLVILKGTRHDLGSRSGPAVDKDH